MEDSACRMTVSSPYFPIHIHDFATSFLMLLPKFSSNRFQKLILTFGPSVYMCRLCLSPFFRIMYIQYYTIIIITIIVFYFTVHHVLGWCPWNDHGFIWQKIDDGFFRHIENSSRHTHRASTEINRQLGAGVESTPSQPMSWSSDFVGETPSWYGWSQQIHLLLNWGFRSDNPTWQPEAKKPTTGILLPRVQCPEVKNLDKAAWKTRESNRRIKNLIQQSSHCLQPAAKISCVGNFQTK